MEAWPGIITEWVNCLEVLDAPIIELKELEDREFYRRILKLIAWQSVKEETDEENILVQFLKEEYPEFKINNENGEREKNRIYIASLFLLYTSQNPMFHQPMCQKLHSEAQTKIKTFLESVIPHGNNITSETLKYAIADLDGTVPNTPMTPRTRGLREFFNSPAAHSVTNYKVLAERNRELRKLKNELEVERFEKGELQEDLENYKSKLQSLHQKLLEKTMELKTLKDEQLNPPTPESCRKGPSNQKPDSYYKREIDCLETKLMEKDIELDTMEEKNGKLTKQLSSMEKQCLVLRETLETSEKTVENLQIQAEQKDSEIANLKATTEELRAYVKELTKSPTEEESFDLSGVGSLHSSTSSFDINEAIDSVIDVQFFEAKRECYWLKAEVETLNKTIETITEERDRLVELNARLEKDAAKLPEVQAELKTALTKLKDTEIALEAKENTLQLEFADHEKDLFKAQEIFSGMETHTRRIMRERTEAEEELHSKTAHVIQLDSTLVEINKDLNTCKQSVAQLKTEKESLKAYIESCKLKLMSIAQTIENNNVGQYKCLELNECIEIILNDLSCEHGAKEKMISSLNTTLTESNLKLKSLESQLAKLQEKHELSVADVRNLTLEADENSILIQDLLDSKKQSAAREEELLQEINSSRVHFEEALAKLSDDHNILQEKYSEEQTRRENVESRLADTEKEMKSIINKKVVLESRLVEIQELKDNLEVNLVETKKDKSRLTEDLEQLRLTFKDEREQMQKEYEKSLEEISNDAKNLRYENNNLSVELQARNDRLNVIQQELDGVQNQMKLKNERIENLLSDIGLLKVEKEHLTRLQAMVESKTKSFVEQLEVQILEKQRAYDQLALHIKLMENTIESLQKEKLDWHTSELKMKEIIMNLQDVRTNQDAVLQTQEKALLDKSLELDVLQKEFELCKVSLNKQIEDEQSLNHTLQNTCQELQSQIEKQKKTIEEFEELLQGERKEKEAIKDYCQNEDAKRLELIKACEILGGLADDLKFTIKEATQDVDDIYANATNIQFTECDDKLKNILNTLESAINEMQASRKLISHLYASNTSLRQALGDHNDLVEKHNENCKEMGALRSKILELEVNEEKRVKHFQNLVKRKRCLNSSLQSTESSREHLDAALSKLEQRWEEIAGRFESVFTINGCFCDELKSIQSKKGHFEKTLHNYSITRLNSIKALNKILWQKFAWIEDQVESSSDCIVDADSAQSGSDDSFANEKDVIDSELQKSELLQKDVKRVQEEMEDFAKEVAAFKVEFEAGEIVLESEVEKKLKEQINELVEEKSNLKSKMDSLRTVNAKLDKQGEELRTKFEELKSEMVPLAEAEDLRKDLKDMKDENRKLREEMEELNKRPKKEDFDKRVKELNDKYEAKVDEMKQKMKSSYNEQVLKLNKDQENCIRERLESLQGKMEQQCRKQAVEINKYKAHVGDLSSQLWSVGEKLLIQKQQRQEIEKQLNELKAKYHNLKLQLTQQSVAVINQKTIKTERRDIPADENVDQAFQKITTLKEKTTFERRCSIQSLQAMGNAFNAADEEGEVFDNIYLADIKDNQPSFSLDPDRMSVLKMRNSMCKPHLKSSYPAEMQFHPIPFNEEELKSGSVPEENFNDSLSQSLLPEQKARKKDKTQTSYRKPGPPTPSRNGGRLSLQGNELKSPNSKVLRERNKDRTTSTPRTLKSIFGSRRQDENALSTPKERRRSIIFRKTRATTNR